MAVALRISTTLYEQASFAAGTKPKGKYEGGGVQKIDVCQPDKLPVLSKFLLKPGLYSACTHW